MKKIATALLAVFAFSTALAAEPPGLIPLDRVDGTPSAQRPPSEPATVIGNTTDMNCGPGANKLFVSYWAATGNNGFIPGSRFICVRAPFNTEPRLKEVAFSLAQAVNARYVVLGTIVGVLMEHEAVAIAAQAEAARAAAARMEEKKAAPTPKK